MMFVCRMIVDVMMFMNVIMFTDVKVGSVMMDRDEKMEIAI